MKPLDLERRSIFVASSEKAYKRGLTTALEAALSQHLPDVDVRPWPVTFEDGASILDQLLKEASHAHFGVFLFTHDRVCTCGGSPPATTAINVVLETGMYLNQVLPGRISLIFEAGVEKPSDVAGIVYLEFATLEQLKEKAANLGMRWAKHKDHSQFGLHNTISALRTQLAKTERGLALSGDGPRKPVVFDLSHIQEAYAEGLSIVRKRFLTTTFFTSGFWKGQAARVMDANKKMLSRLEDVKGQQCRRVFLLADPPEVMFAKVRDDIEVYRARGMSSKVEEEFQKIRDLRDHMAELDKQGFDIRVTHDARSVAWERHLPDAITKEHKPLDAELAVYDDIRVDVYSGGSIGVTTRLESHTPASANAESIVEAAANYISELFERGQKPKEFFRDWLNAVAVARDGVDYVLDWPTLYDSMTGEDAKLKELEYSYALKVARSHFGDARPKRYLDVGSCTARYPLGFFRDKVINADTRAIALDKELACANAIEKKLAEFNAQNAPGPQLDLGIELDDFIRWANSPATGAPFDLVTCMLGTISHFGLKRWDTDGDYLSEAVEQLYAMVAPGGLLLLTAWTPYAIHNRKFLSIYAPDTRARFAQWSPPRERLGALLKEVGFETDFYTPDNRVDVYTCLRDTGTVG